MTNNLCSPLFQAACLGDGLAQSALADMLEEAGTNPETLGHLVDYTRWQVNKPPSLWVIPQEIVTQVRQTLLEERLALFLREFCRALTLPGVRASQAGQVILDTPIGEEGITCHAFWNKHLNQKVRVSPSFMVRSKYTHTAVSGKPTLHPVQVATWTDQQWKQAAKQWTEGFLRYETDHEWAQREPAAASIYATAAKSLIAAEPNTLAAKAMLAADTGW